MSSSWSGTEPLFPPPTYLETGHPFMAASVGLDKKTQAKENGDSNSIASMDATPHEIGTLSSSSQIQAHPGRLVKKLQLDLKRERRISESSNSPGSGKFQAEKGALLPKFGDWDANDPSSGSKFTVIFDKARDEKKTGGALRMSSRHSLLSSKSPRVSKKMQNASHESSCPSWSCCCFYPAASK